MSLTEDVKETMDEKLYSCSTPFVVLVLHIIHIQLRVEPTSSILTILSGITSNVTSDKNKLQSEKVQKHYQ